MKLLLRKNVGKLGRIGDIVNVTDGYARNYLVPTGLAIQPTEANIRAVEAQKAAYLAELARQKAELQAAADAIQGKEITISARANEEGHLYGSVGPAQICEALAMERIFLEPENIALEEPIRQLDKYDVVVRFGEDVTATIHVWVVPVREAGEDVPPPPGGEEAPPGEAPAEAAGEAPAEGEGPGPAAGGGDAVGPA
jgi:large subunit ribosomal protein L9